MRAPGTARFTDSTTVAEFMAVWEATHTSVNSTRIHGPGRHQVKQPLNYHKAKVSGLRCTFTDTQPYRDNTTAHLVPYTRPSVCIHDTMHPA